MKGRFYGRTDLRAKKERKKERERKIVRKNSPKSVRWSAVLVAPKLVHVRCEGERGSGPEGTDDLCWAKIRALRLGFEPRGWN